MPECSNVCQVTSVGRAQDRGSPVCVPDSEYQFAAGHTRLVYFVRPTALTAINTATTLRRDSW